MIKLFFILLGKYRLLKAKTKANSLHKMTGKRYYVIPYQKGRLIVVDNNYVKLYNKYNKSKITIERLLLMSYYHTK